MSVHARSISKHRLEYKKIGAGEQPRYIVLVHTFGNTYPDRLYAENFADAVAVAKSEALSSRVACVDVYKRLGRIGV